MPQKIKKYFLSLLILELLFSYAPAFAQSPSPDYSTSGVAKQIEQYLCNPAGGGNGVLYQCINQLYKFAIVLASVIGVLFIVIAGYVYMAADGNTESVDKAKSILESTITALVILIGGWVFLNTINPDLVQFHGNTLQPVVITAPVETPGAGGGVITKGLTDQQARTALKVAGIAIFASDLNGTLQQTVNELVKLKQTCGCTVNVTSTTGGAHSTSLGGTGHADGCKADLAMASDLTSYIASNFIKMSPRQDKYGPVSQWRSNFSASVYAKEDFKSTDSWSGAHWDIKACN